ncbi:MAG: hypothetical protein WCL02_02600 [bacterium]
MSVVKDIPSSISLPHAFHILPHCPVEDNLATKISENQLEIKDVVHRELVEEKSPTLIIFQFISISKSLISSLQVPPACFTRIHCPVGDIFAINISVSQLLVSSVDQKYHDCVKDPPA